MGSEHMRLARTTIDQQLLAPTDWKIATVEPPEATCIKCHDVDNDPHWKGDIWPYDKMVAEIGCSQWLAVPQGN